MKALIKIILCLCLLSSSIYAQVIWSEDFESYSVSTGYVGSTSLSSAIVSGDYPSLVTKWTIDTALAELTANSDWLSVQEDEVGNNVFEIRDADGESIWSSEVIDISGYLDIILSVSLTEISNLESTDYINVYYKLDGAAEVLFETSGSNTNDFTSAKATQSNITGTTIQIVIRSKNNAGTEQIRFDDVFVRGKNLLITEVSHPSDNGNAAFIELRNGSNHNINFDSIDYFLAVQTNGNSWSDLQLEGNLCSGCIRVYAQSSSAFSSAYNFNPGQSNALFNGDGNDAYFIFYNGDHSTGSIVDVYGVVNEDGTGQVWDYENSRAIRKTEVVVGVSIWDSDEWIISNATISNMTPGTLEGELRYFNSVWHPSTIAPSSSSDDKNIIVQSGSVTLNENIECSDFQVNSGGIVLVNPGIGLNVSGDFSNKGLFTLQSDVNSCSSLIVGGTSTGSLSYNLYLEGGASSPWHLISTPVKNQGISSFVTASANNIQTSENNNYGLAEFNSNTNSWNYFHNGLGISPNITATSAGNFQSALGYSVLRSSSGIVNFSGALNVNDQSIELIPDKWNLVGNPYPSYLNVNSGSSSIAAILTDNSFAINDLYEAIYLWNASTSEYDIINQASSATYLSPGQGFYVLSDANAGSIDFTESLQSHQVGDWFMRSNSHPSIKIFATIEGQTKSTEIKFVDGTTLGFDVGYDAVVFDGNVFDFYTYSQLSDETYENLELGIQCIPFLSTSDINIPIGLEVSEASVIDFSFELESFKNTSQIYFKDLFSDSLVNVMEQDVYSVTVGETEPSIGRFRICSTTSIDEVSIEERFKEKVRLYTENGILHINGAAQLPINLKIYDTIGRILKEESTNFSKCDISNFPKGVYVVLLNYKNHTINRKITF